MTISRDILSVVRLPVPPWAHGVSSLFTQIGYITLKRKAKDNHGLNFPLTLSFFVVTGKTALERWP